LLRLASNYHLPISASQITGITGKLDLEPPSAALIYDMTSVYLLNKERREGGREGEGRIGICQALKRERAFEADNLKQI
jgi:hypothetical protein